MFFDELLENPVESTAQIACARMAATGALRPFLRELVKVRYLNRKWALSSGSEGYCSCLKGAVRHRDRVRQVSKLSFVGPLFSYPSGGGIRFQAFNC